MWGRGAFTCVWREGCIHMWGEREGCINMWGEGRGAYTCEGRGGVHTHVGGGEGSYTCTCAYSIHLFTCLLHMMVFISSQEKRLAITGKPDHASVEKMLSKQLVSICACW